MKKLNTMDFQTLIGLEMQGRQLRLEYCPKTHKHPLEVIELVEQEWAKKARSYPQGPGYLNSVSQLCRYESCRIVGDEVVIEVSETDYKYAYGTNIRRPDLASKYGVDALANPLAVCGLVLGSDETLLLLHRSRLVLDKPGWWHTVGGHLELHQRLSPNDPAFVASELSEELHEELPTIAPEILELKPTCLIRSTQSHKVEIGYLVETSLQLDNLSSITLSFEHDAYVVLPCEISEIASFAQTHWHRMVEGTKAMLFYFCLLRFGAQAVQAYWTTDDRIDPPSLEGGRRSDW